MPKRRSFGLPSGAVHVAIGLAVLGLTSYVFLTVSARRLSPVDFASVSVLWSVVYIAGPGIFQPFEQQIGRSLSARRAQGDPSMGLVGRAARAASIVLAVLAAVTVAAARPLAHSLFGGSYVVVVALVASFAALACAHVYRGVIAGQGRFDLYGAQLGTEGAVRFIGCLALTVVGAAWVGYFALLIPLAQVVSVLVSLRPRLLHARAAGPAVAEANVAGPGAGPLREGGLGLTLFWLVVAAALSQTLVNAATVLVKLLGRDDAAAAGHLLAGLMVARLPLFMFAAVQAALLPGLAALVALGRGEALRRRVLVLCVGLSGVMALVTVVIGVAGPWAVRLLFGASFELSGGVLAALTAGTGLFMVATVLASAVMAIGRFPVIAACWGLGVAVMLAVTAAPFGLVTRVVAGFVAGAAAACVGLTAAFGWSARELESATSDEVIADGLAMGAEGDGA